MKKSTWHITLQPDPNGSEDALMIIPDEVFTELGWKEGDKLKVERKTNGSMTLSKQCTE